MFGLFFWCKKKVEIVCIKFDKSVEKIDEESDIITTEMNHL